MTARRQRSGTTVVVALGLLLLAMALLGTAVRTTTETSRVARAERAAMSAEFGARFALAGATSGWQNSHDSLRVGASVERTLTRDECGGQSGAPVTGRLMVQRLDTALFLIAVDIRIGSATTMARRRAQLVLARPVQRDSTGLVITATASPVAISHWGLSEIP